MDRIGLAPNFERHVDLSIAIDDPDIPVEGRVAVQLGTLDARVYCIHDIPVVRRALGVRKQNKIGGRSHSLGQLW